MHILLLIGAIPLKAITLLFSVFISMENSDAVVQYVMIDNVATAEGI
jgi:hypothetical protein